MIKIAVDAMGGDNAPSEIVKGAVEAVSERPDITVCLTGQEDIIKKELEKYGVIIEKFYYCPHHPEKGVGKYKTDCLCRKPNTGMLDAAIKEFNIDTAVSFMVGDTLADIDAGQKAGLTPVLVKTGHGMETLEKIGDRKIDIYNSLYDFALSLK